MENTNSLRRLQENKPESTNQTSVVSLTTYFVIAVLIAAIILSVVIEFIPLCILYIHHLLEQFSTL